MKSIICLIAALLTSGVCQLPAQSFDRAKMDSLFTLIENNNRGMGSFSIFEDGKEMYRRSYGYADVENKVKANAFTKYRVGSISKTFTSTIILKLVEEGKLSLSATLAQYYPQVTNGDKITIEHLLRHRSGIANFTGVSDYSQWNTTEHTKDQVLERILKGGTTFEPGTKFEYSNSNYVLLTYIAEDVSGQPFNNLLNRIIVSPCHLKNTYIGGKIDKAKQEAYSYMWLDGWKKQPETSMSIPLGAGFIVSTPTDLNVFFQHLFMGRLVSKASLEKMTTLKDNFGMGLLGAPFYHSKGYGHTGGIDGFNSFAYYLPDKKVSVAITQNGLVYPVNDIVVGALSIYFGKEYKLPTFTQAIALSEEELDKYQGVYATPALPIKMTISRKGNTLTAQGTGQPAFPVESFGVNKFRNETYKVELEFVPEEKKMILRQMGMAFEMMKEEE